MEVGLFIPCYVEQFYPQVGIATLELLEKLQIKVHYNPSQTCCGQPIANSGLEHEATPIYQHFVDIFSKYEYIVGPSASCVYHIRKHFNILEQTESVTKIREKTFELTEFLVDVLGTPKIESSFPFRVGLHQGCHGLRGLRIAQSSERVLPYFSKWKSLLDQIQDITMVDIEFPDECCGFGGTFAVFEPDVSVKMGTDKIQAYLDQEVEFVTSSDMSCLMHLDGIIKKRGLNLEVKHIAELLNHQ